MKFLVRGAVCRILVVPDMACCRLDVVVDSVVSQEDEEAEAEARGL